MVMSVDTTKQVLEIVTRYVPAAQIDKMLAELAQVTGNQSFCDSVVRLQKILL